MTPPAGNANNKLWCQAITYSGGSNYQYDTGPSRISASTGTYDKYAS